MKIHNKILAGAVAMATASMSMNVYADTTEDLINALVTKGVLTEDEGALLSRSHGKKMANTPTIKNSGGKFTLQSADGKNAIAITGRMHFDTRASSLDSDDVSNADALDAESDRDFKSINAAGEHEMRRARLGIKGKLDGVWKYNVVLNAAGKGKKGMDTAELTFAPSKAFNIKMGQFKQAFNLEGLTSSNDIDTMERSFVNQISPHKKLGIGLTGLYGNKKAGSWMVTKYQEAFKDTDIDANANYSARLTYDFAKANKMKNNIFHVGVSGFTEDYGMTPKTSSNSSINGTTHARIIKFKSAGRGYSPLFGLDVQGASATGVKFSKQNVQVESEFGGLEAIIASGPFKLQSEYTSGEFEAENYVSGGDNTTASADVKAWYLTAGYILTPGVKYSKSYKGGKMKGLKVPNPFDFKTGKGMGTWELIARIEGYQVDDININNGAASGSESRIRGTASGGDCASTADTYKVSSGTVSGCKSQANTYTLGINWLANKNVKFRAAYAQTNFDADVLAPDNTDAKAFDDEGLFSMRMQYMF